MPATPTDTRLRVQVVNLIHDLRQPLSTIETCTYLLGMILPGDDPRAHEQLEIIALQVQEIERLLTEMAGPQRDTKGESRSFTNAAMAAVT